MLKTTEETTSVGNDMILTARQAADVLGLTVATLAQWRIAGNHPLKFIRLSHQVVRYRLGDIQSFLRAHTVRPLTKKRRRA